MPLQEIENVSLNVVRCESSGREVDGDGKTCHAEWTRADLQGQCQGTELGQRIEKCYIG